MKVAVHCVGEPLDTASRLALTGGVAAYLAGHVGFRLRVVGAVSGAKLAAAAGALAVFALGGGLPAWAVAAVLAAVLGALCGYEALLARAGLGRHGSALTRPSGSNGTGTHAKAASGRVRGRVALLV